MKVTVEIQGLEQFRRRIQDHNILTSELKRAERDGLTVIRDEAKSEASGFSNVLPQSIRMEPKPSGLEGIVGSVARTALSIYEGRRPGNAPSYETIEKWLTRRGHGAAQLIKSRRYVKPRKGSAASRSLRGEAIIVVNAIRQSGTAPLPFVIPAAEASHDRVTRAFDSAITRALKRFAGKV